MKNNALLLLSLAVSTGAAAQQVEEIIVIGVVPAGSSIETNKLAYPVQTATAEDLENVAALSIADFLRQSFTSISLNDAQNNPLQPDLQYRGFTASPLLGLAQGIAVYQNGVRINEPLGDAVNWDLMPQSAIQEISLGGGSNPLYGLNSLGGSLAIDMKDGFDFEGANLEVSTGSFGRRTSNIEFGGNDGQLAYYLNIEHFDEDGWRDNSESDALNIYASIGWRSDYTQINLNYQHGESELIGNGSSPIELIDLDRKAIFTGPDITENDMNMVSFDFSHEVSSSISFSGNIFHRENDTDSFNGDGTEFGICEFGGMDTLIEGIEEDDLEELGLDDDDICESQFGAVNSLEDFLNITAKNMGEDEEFESEGLVNTHEQALDRLIEQALIRQVIRQAELSASDSEIDAAIAGIAGDNNITASELRTSVEKQGLSFSEYREKIGDELEQHKVIQGMVMSKIRIDEEELKTIYENEYAQETGEGLEVQISQILIPRAADSEACDKVRAARERVVAGEPFPLVASQTSYVNPNGGGSLGWTSVSDLIGWMRDLAETLPPGAMSEVVELPHACSVLVVTDRRDASERSFSDVRDKIARAVRRERSDEQYRLFIDDMRSRTYIDRRTTFKPEDFRISDE